MKKKLKKKLDKQYNMFYIIVERMREKTKNSKTRKEKTMKELNFDNPNYNDLFPLSNDEFNNIDIIAMNTEYNDPFDIDFYDEDLEDFDNELYLD